MTCIYPYSILQSGFTAPQSPVFSSHFLSFFNLKSFCLCRPLILWKGWWPEEAGRLLGRGPSYLGLSLVPLLWLLRKRNQKLLTYLSRGASEQVPRELELNPGSWLLHCLWSVIHALSCLWRLHQVFTFVESGWLGLLGWSPHPLVMVGYKPLDLLVCGFSFVAHPTPGDKTFRYFQWNGFFSSLRL